MQHSYHWYLPLLLCDDSERQREEASCDHAHECPPIHHWTTSPTLGSQRYYAHGRMAALQRLDDQVAALLDQRRKVQDELRTIQTLINEELGK